MTSANACGILVFNSLMSRGWFPIKIWCRFCTKWGGAFSAESLQNRATNVTAFLQRNHGSKLLQRWRGIVANCTKLHPTVQICSDSLEAYCRSDNKKLPIYASTSSISIAPTHTHYLSKTILIMIIEIIRICTAFNNEMYICNVIRCNRYNYHSWIQQQF